MQIKRLATQYQNISKQGGGIGSSAPHAPYVQAT